MLKRVISLVIVFTMLFSITVFALPEGVPDSLETPTIQNLELLKNESGVPYFRVEVKVPQSVLDLDKERPTGGWVDLETLGKVDNEEWGSTGGGGGHLDTFVERSETGKPGVCYVEFDVEDEGSMTETIIKARNYKYKVRFCYSYYTGDDLEYVYSDWSNELSNKSGSYYEGASDWAVAELNRAQEYGFITDKIKGNMSGPITREEFAEVAVKLYEKYTGTTAEYPDMNAFVDTKNPEIFKAANLKIVNGTNLEKKLFSPKDLTNRQQVAAMLYRAVKSINPDADFSTAGAENFKDAAQIEKYAVDPVKFMSKNGFIKGSAGMFNPKGTCTREMAVLIAVRVYEKYAGK